MSLRICGSSPQMRGALTTVQTFTVCVGIIPADAGSTPRKNCMLSGNTDHPRRCGEHYGHDRSRQARGGSSPQMRGALAVPYLLLTGVGIIPADAGSTPVSAIRVLGSWDHPRRCGEHVILVRLIQIMVGSSPQMRGALVIILLTIYSLRIIPADAGSTGRGKLQRPDHADHPRRCGEHNSPQRMA